MKYILADGRNKANGFRGYLWRASDAWPKGGYWDGRALAAVQDAQRFTLTEVQAKVADIGRGEVVAENEI